MTFRSVFFVACIAFVAAMLASSMVHYERTYISFDGLPAGPVGDVIRKELKATGHDEPARYRYSIFGWVIEEVIGLDDARQPVYRGIPGGLIGFRGLVVIISVLTALIPVVFLKRFRQLEEQRQSKLLEIHCRPIT